MSTARIQAALSGSETFQRHPPGYQLFREGDEPAGIYILHSGSIDLVFSAPQGKGKSLRTAEPGQILGLSPVVLGRAHDCSAIARTDCSVSFIDRDDFVRALEEEPGVWFSVLSILSHDVNAVYDDMRAGRAFSGAASR